MTNGLSGQKKQPKDRRIDRHRPGYWAEFKRKWRAEQKMKQTPPPKAAE